MQAICLNIHIMLQQKSANHHCLNLNYPEQCQLQGDAKTEI